MSIYLTAAMQMFGRAQDALSHVLVSEPFEMNQEFFYIPPSPRMLKTRDGQEISTNQLAHRGATRLPARGFLAG